ncbi:hypothetical protein FTX61_18780 [Nitriliruptoraceae bacterium ZYF776]|nr:hypothetical protein [Profundirhabdus halotolerans]
MGITIDDRYRRRHVPWSEVAAVRLRWEHAVRRPALPHIERRDGEELHGSVLSGVGKDDRGAERAALLARLEEAAQQHGFVLDVAPPPPRWGSSWKVGAS